MNGNGSQVRFQGWEVAVGWASEKGIRACAFEDEADG